MIKKIVIFILLSLLCNCARDPVIKLHGISYLEKRQKSLLINQSNKNDVRDSIGSPSSVGIFDQTVWIYIEKADTNTRITTLGKKKNLKNNVLVLKFDKYGILQSKKLYNKDQMNKIKFSSEKTSVVTKEQDFIYNFLSSIRQKMLRRR